MYKILLFVTIVLFFGCASETTEKAPSTTKLYLDQHLPETEFEQCLNLTTFQLLAAAKEHLETFITNSLISEGEDLAIGYQRFCMAWTGETISDMDTKSLLDDGFANALYEHPNYKDIWVRLTELGDTTYTEELAYDENNNGVIVKFIENYWTLNTNGSYYKCIHENGNLRLRNYLINKEYGNIEPQDFALELYESTDLAQFNDPMIQSIIVTDLYLRLIAVRKGS